MKRLAWFMACILFMVGKTPAQTHAPSGIKGKIIRTYREYDHWVSSHPNQLMVDLSAYIRAIDVRMPYASTQNFTHQILYPSAKAFLNERAASALRAAANELIQKGYGLIIYDAYRPYSVTQKMWKYEPNSDYAANPSTGSDHNRGIAVDIGLYDLKTHHDLPMPSPFDSFTESAHTNAMNLPDSVLANRDLLQHVMVAHGFKPLQSEWWHFTYVDTVLPPIMDLGFKDVEKELQK